MNIKNLFCNPRTTDADSSDVVIREMTYAEMLGLNRDFIFGLTKDTVIDEADFNAVAKAAKDLLEQDLKRLGEKFYVIEPALRNRLRGSIGSMTLIADDDNKVTVRFHYCDGNGNWDGISKNFPEKNSTGKYKDEIFFLLETEDD